MSDGDSPNAEVNHATGSIQSSFLGPIEKIRRVLKRLEGEDFDLKRIDLSGGKDSFVAAEAVYRLGPEYGIELDMVAHYTTGTGIPSTTKLVQEYCAERGLPYVEGMNKKPKEMVGPQALDYGYYGSGEGRVMADRKHATAYVLRKQRVEDGLYGGFSGDILQFSGAYYDESDSRGAKMDGAIKWGETGKKKPRLTIASPIYALTEGEVETLAERWNVPEAPAYATLDASGDCTGCAYDQAGRFGNLWAEAPNVAFAHATLMVWIQIRRARGELNLPPERVFYGWGSLDDETVEALLDEDEFYDPDEDIGPTAPEYAATYDEDDEDGEDEETEPPLLDPDQKRFTCSDCDDRCEPAIPVTLADGGEPRGR